VGAWLILALACSRNRDRQKSKDVTPALGSAHPLQARYEPGTISCGAGLCQIGSEGCCQNVDEQACAPLAKIPGAPRAFFGLERWPDCTKAKLKFEVSEVSLCDDSSDCSDSEICCSMWLVSGARSSLCVPGKASGSNVCDYFERCVEGQACRVKETECVNGRCELRGGTLRCGHATCVTPAQVCCSVGGRLACANKAACDVPTDTLPTIYHCTGPAACPIGAYCAESLLGTSCQGLVDVVGTTILCEAARDCPVNWCELQQAKGPPRCVPGKKGWGVCSCSAG